MNQIKGGALLSYLLIILNNIIGITYTPFMIRTLGKSEFGLYSLAAAVVGYLTIMDLGFGNAIIRFTSKYKALGDVKTQNNLHGMFIVIYSGIGLLVAFLGCILYFNTDLIFSDAMSIEELKKIKVLLALLTFNLAITFPFSIFGSIIVAHENFIFSKIINIFRVAINPLIMIPLLLYGYKSIALVVVMTSLNVITLLINFTYCKIKIGIKPNYGFFDMSLLKEIVGYSFYVFLVVIVNQVYWNTGQFVLGAVAGTVAVAVFAVAMTVKNLYFSFSTSIVGVLLPKLTQMVTAKASNKELSDIFIKVGRLQFIILSLILSGFIIFGKTFIELWAGKDYSSSYTMALWIMVPVTVPLIQNLGITILQAKNQQKFRAISLLVVATLNVIITIPLAKELEGLGCAIVTGASLIIGNGIIMNIYYHKKIGLNIAKFWLEMLKISIPVILSVSIFMLLNSVVKLQFSILFYIIKIVFYGLIFLSLMWFIGMNSYEKNIFKKLIHIRK